MRLQLEGSLWKGKRNLWRSSLDRRVRNCTLSGRLVLAEATVGVGLISIASR